MCIYVYYILQAHIRLLKSTSKPEVSGVGNNERFAHFSHWYPFFICICVGWTEGNDHLGAMQQVGSYVASFAFPSSALFQKDPRGRLIFFCKYQSHGSGEMLFPFAQRELFLPLVHVNICLLHHDIFDV